MQTKRVDIDKMERQGQRLRTHIKRKEIKVKKSQILVCV